MVNVFAAKKHFMTSLTSAGFNATENNYMASFTSYGFNATKNNFIASFTSADFNSYLFHLHMLAAAARDRRRG